MGRQFSYYCLPEDLAEIQRKVFVPAQGVLVCAIRKDSAHYLTPVLNFALGRDAMGHEELHLLLLPPVAAQCEVRNGPWIDTEKSHVIEVGRCYTDGRILRRARFWYETRYYKQNNLYTKPHDFVAWAETVFRRTKGVLQRHETAYNGRKYVEWFGPQAWVEVSSGGLQPVSN